MSSVYAFISPGYDVFRSINIYKSSYSGHGFTIDCYRAADVAHLRLTLVRSLAHDNSGSTEVAEKTTQQAPSSSHLQSRSFVHTYGGSETAQYRLWERSRPVTLEIIGTRAWSLPGERCSSSRDNESIVNPFEQGQLPHLNH